MASQEHVLLSSEKYNRLLDRVQKYENEQTSNESIDKKHQAKESIPSEPSAETLTQRLVEDSHDLKDSKEKDHIKEIPEQAGQTGYAKTEPVGVKNADMQEFHNRAITKTPSADKSRRPNRKLNRHPLPQRRAHVSTKRGGAQKRITQEMIKNKLSLPGKRAVPEDLTQPKDKSKKKNQWARL